MPKLYRRLVRRGDHILLNGKNGAWMRIDVLDVEGMRVHLGLASSKDYRPRLKGQGIRAGRVKIVAMKKQGMGGVQLGITVPPEFRVASRNQPLPQEVADLSTQASVLKEAEALPAPSPERQNDEEIENSEPGISSSPWSERHHGIRSEEQREMARELGERAGDAEPQASRISDWRINQLLQLNQLRLR